MESASKGQLVFTEGHDTKPVDNGRPVVLIANALGVESSVFRDAFSGVTPAKNGRPTSSHAMANKKVLMDKLSSHGITNERLDEVSDYYRYRPQTNELWNHEPAVAAALIENGKVRGFEISSGGFGYTSPPRVRIAGYEDVRVVAELQFSSDFEKNGSVKSLKLVD